MTVTEPVDVLDRALADAQRLPVPDLQAADALAAAMGAWTASDLAAYRSAVLDELTGLGGGRVHGFLAVELAALAAVEASGA